MCGFCARKQFHTTAIVCTNETTRCLCYIAPVAAPQRLFRDPDSIPRHGHGTERDLDRVGNWTLAEREKMDERFAAAMMAAGYASTLPSTHFGTICPVANHQRE